MILDLSYKNTYVMGPDKSSPLMPKRYVVNMFSTLEGRIKQFAYQLEMMKKYTGVQLYLSEYSKRVVVKSVWFKMLEFVANNSGCTAKAIREYMGWHGDRNHCDYFSTLLADRIIMKSKGRTPKYFVTDKGANILEHAISNKESVKKRVDAFNKRNYPLTLEDYKKSEYNKLKKSNIRRIKAEKAL